MGVTKANRILWFYLKQGGKCYYCEKVLWDGENLLPCNIDHKIPTSRGGKDTIENTCLSCQPCNTEKGSMTEEEVKIARDLMAQGKINRKDIPDYMKYLNLKAKFDRSEV